MAATLPTLDEIEELLRRVVREEVGRIRSDSPPRLLTVDEAATALGVHAGTVRRRIKAGEIKAVRLGRSVRIHPSEVAPPDDGQVVELAHAARFDR